LIFRETELEGAYIIEQEKFKDFRGHFARLWCKKEFEEHGLINTFVQINNSVCIKKGTIRGLHYQTAPYEEAKLIRCTRGSIFDVIIDLRKNSDTYKKWISVELTAENGNMVYVPPNFAHAYQSLTDDTEMIYPVSQFYHPECERGICWNDSEFNIDWPIKDDLIISKKDKDWPQFDS
jgi:dTDP-4-dehydrorhamnose 3,5-epimerase